MQITDECWRPLVEEFVGGLVRATRVSVSKSREGFSSPSGSLPHNMYDRQFLWLIIIKSSARCADPLKMRGLLLSTRYSRASFTMGKVSTDESVQIFSRYRVLFSTFSTEVF